MAFPRSIRNLIDQFNRLPGIGPKTSERFIFYLLQLPKSDLEEFAQSIRDLKENIMLCNTCFSFDELDPCHRCADPKRERGVICVVAQGQDVIPIEKTEDFNGLYHVLGGTINHIEGIGPDQLHIGELVRRIDSGGVQEVILALNPDLEGETTSMYLSKLLKEKPVRVTRLAQGLPTGSNIEYADMMTLSHALKDRKEV